MTHSEPKSRTSDAEPFNPQAYKDRLDANRLRRGSDSSDEDDDLDDDNDDGDDDDAPFPAAAVPTAPPVSPSAAFEAPLLFPGEMEELELLMRDGTVSPAPSTATEPCQWEPEEK